MLMSIEGEKKDLFKSLIFPATPWISVDASLCTKKYRPDFINSSSLPESLRLVKAHLLVILSLCNESLSQKPKWRRWLTACSGPPLLNKVQSKQAYHHLQTHLRAVICRVGDVTPSCRDGRKPRQQMCVKKPHKKWLHRNTRPQLRCGMLIRTPK